MKMIRVTEVKVAHYVPDYTETFYKDLAEKTLEAALEADKKDYDDKEITLDDLDTKVTIDTKWEIVEVE